MAEIPSGVGFGELSIIEGKTRAATIQCAEDENILATLHKDDYEVVKQMEVKKLDEIIDFLKSFSFFKHLSRRYLSKIRFYLKENKFKMGNTVYRDGEHPKGIHLIRSGEFQIMKVLSPNRDPSHDKRFGYKLIKSKPK